MFDCKKTEIRILFNGPVIVNSAWVEVERDDVAAICVDCETKYFEISATGGSEDSAPSIYLGKTNNSLYLNENPESSLTEVNFSEYKGWDVFCSDASKYSAYVCLVKRKEF